jgi:hypothetical protein
MAGGLARGTSLLIPNTGPAHARDRDHLFFVLTNRCSNGNCLLVPLCSLTPKCDQTCLLDVGDHAFIARPSFVFYAKMQIYSGSHLLDQMTAGLAEDRGLIPDKVFERICAGVSTSPFSRPVYQRYYLANSV